MVRDITLSEAQKRVAVFLDERGWTPKSGQDKLYTLAHMMEELGEVARCISHLESSRKEIMGREEAELMENLHIELGDVMYHVFKLASAYGLDAQEIFSKTMEKNVKKYPLKKFKKN